MEIANKIEANLCKILEVATEYILKELSGEVVDPKILSIALKLLDQNGIELNTLINRKAEELSKITFNKSVPLDEVIEEAEEEQDSWSVYS